MERKCRKERVDPLRKGILTRDSILWEIDSAFLYCEDLGVRLHPASSLEHDFDRLYGRIV